MSKIFERAFLEPNSIDAVSVEIEDVNSDDEWFGAELVLNNKGQSFIIYFSDYEYVGDSTYTKEQFQVAVNKLRILKNALGLIETNMIEYAKERYPELLEQPVSQEIDQEVEVTAEEEEYQQGLVQVNISDKVNEFQKL